MDIKLPNLGEGAESGVVVSLHVKEGDSVEKDQVILELENEKAVAPIPSTISGKVTKIHVKEGDKISVGQTLVSLSEETKPEKTQEETIKPKEESVTQKEDKEDIEINYGISELEEPSKSDLPPAASPTIRKIARDLGIDLTRVKGSERGGRIVLKDLNRYVQTLQQIALGKGKPTPDEQPKPTVGKVDFSKWGPVTKKPISALRKAIAQKMSESWSVVTRVTQFDEADITDLLQFRKKYSAAFEKEKVHLTLTPLILKAIIPALKKYPDFNSSLDLQAGEIIVKQYYHIGVAVDTDAGLLVPVIKDVDKKNILQLAKELDELAEKAKQRKLTLDELKGSSFTISNQGGIGGGHFTPIVNTPDTAILGIGKGVQKPVVRDNKVEIRTILPLSLSYDHRIVDGANAVRFLLEIIQNLEQFKEVELKI